MNGDYKKIKTYFELNYFKTKTSKKFYKREFCKFL